MKLFTIDKTNKLHQYKEEKYKKDNFEKDLENLLEKNPEYFFEDSNILIIGRQITTNLNTSIDLLGIDNNGNTIIIELKRERTPRETIAQILEYASFVENLNYKELNSIFKNYSGEEVELEEYHRQFYKNNINDKVAFNKTSKLTIVAQNITKEIKQTAVYLRKSGIDIICMEFKYFKTNSGEKIITCDYVVGDEEFKKQELKSESLPKINKIEFIKLLDEDGKTVFNKLFNFADKMKLVFIWGSKGFSLNLPIKGENIALLFGYPPNSVFKQSIYTGFESINRKIDNSDDIIDEYRNKLEATGKFKIAGKNIKWIINKKYSDDEIQIFIDIIKNTIKKITEKTKSNSD